MIELNKIYNMDCLEGMKQIEDESIDAIITDPPYNTGMKEKGDNSWLSHFFFDDYSDEEYANLVNKSCAEYYRILKKNKPLYIFINWKSLCIWLNALKKVGFSVKNVIVWDKKIHGLNWQYYSYTYELIIFAVKGEFIPNNKGYGDKYYQDVWHIERNLNNQSEKVSHHETEKPVKIINIILKHSTKEGDIVLDPFLGSGTTAVACINLGRNFIGFEINKEYCDVANKRIAEAQAQKKISGVL
jgi:DNA modification methylase